MNTIPNPNRYKLLDCVAIQNLPPLTWCIKGVFPTKVFAAMYGASGSGKSFLALDMAAAIASGEPWFGLKTTATPVVYLWLEAESGIQNRVAAWRLERKTTLPADLRIVMQPFNLTVQQDVQDIAAAIPAGSVVIIDTLNRAAPTVDENSSKEMGVILQACREIQLLTNGLVVLIHHPGKDASKGLRGHSSVFAALDGSIEVKNSAAGRSWSVTKSKDGEGGATFPFKLRVHNLGKDADGGDITSCAVQLAGVFQIREPTGKQQRPALRQLKAVLQKSAYLGKAECGVQTKCLPVEEAIKAIAGTLTTVAKHKCIHRAKDVLDGLVKGGHVNTGFDGDDCWVWLL